MSRLLRVLSIVVVACVAATVLSVPDASAGPEDRAAKRLERKLRKQAEREAAQERHERPAPGLSLDDAVRKVKRRHPKADVVGAQTREGREGRAVHEVKILKQNGQVKTYRFDAVTGADLG